MWFALAIAAASLAVWIYLVGAHGGFWRASERDDRDSPPEPETWPEVVAVIPARDEAQSIGETGGSLLAQDYPGRFAVVLVDDQSTEGTATAGPSVCHNRCVFTARSPAWRRHAMDRW